jgi:hypothetical protein
MPAAMGPLKPRVIGPVTGTPVEPPAGCTLSSSVVVGVGDETPPSLPPHAINSSVESMAHRRAVPPVIAPAAVANALVSSLI